MTVRHTQFHFGKTGDPKDRRAIVPTGTSSGAPHLPTGEVEAAVAYARAEKSAATRRAYKSDFEIFRIWCEARRTSALPAVLETVAAFLGAEADSGLLPSTIGRRLAAIRYAHKLAGLQVPTDDERVRATMRGIRRCRGAAPAKKAPATAEKVMAMAAMGDGIASLRDRALLLFGFASAMRRSELTALDVSDIAETPDGILVTIRHSKTDQEGHGEVIAVPRGTMACPVAALKAWLDGAGITKGPMFRPIAKGGHVQDFRLSDRSIATIIKARATRVGLDPGQYSGHSLRSGFLSSAAARGASIFRMADQSRHKSMDVLRGYVRSEQLFENHAGNGLL
jgi:site-specific recombinase XerD